MSISFLLSAALDLSWRFSWVAFSAIVAWSIVVMALRLIRFEAVWFDAFLFSFFIFFFTILEPVVYALSGLDFPYPWATEIRNNSVANGTGAILSVFLMSYFAGRISFRFRARREQGAEVNKRPERTTKFSSGIVLFFSLLSTYPFMAYGSSGLIGNFLINITGRQTGYVAFSDGAIGSSDPISVLIAQLIPGMVVLNGVMAATGRVFYRRFLHFSLFIFLFVLLVSLGGRTWVVMVVLTLLSAIYFNSRKLSDRVFFFLRMALLSTLLIGALQFQIQQRHYGYEGASSSGFVGFDINREIAFIYDTVPARDGFVIADTLFEQILMPIPTYTFFVITNPVPRIIWTNKPFDPSFVYINERRTGYSGLETTSNITVSIPGRAYVNFGWPGVVQYAFLLGFLLSMFSRGILLTSPDSALRIICIFSICLVAVNFRELQAGKFYPIFWLVFVLWAQRSLARFARSSFSRPRCF
jgi:oligosaccharide repeat unit polymerase